MDRISAMTSYFFIFHWDKCIKTEIVLIGSVMD